MNKTKHKIITGDSRLMNEIEDKSIQLIITSPPYWQLKDYGTDNQIGYNDNYEQYINNLNLVWAESYRVLESGCKLCINIGDQYARTTIYGRYKVIPIRTEIIKFCEAIGFDYMGAVIWQKTGTTNTTGGASIMGSFPHPRNGIFKLDYEFILVFKKQGKSKKRIPKEIKEQSAMTIEEWNKYFTGHWNFGGVRQEGHIAMFPPELPKRLIKMFSFTGDTVLDPFLGSGTTSMVAQKLQRNSVGYEINPEFISLIQEKIGQNSNSLYDNPEFEFITQEKITEDFEHSIKNQPYIFKDFVKLEKKTDPKKLSYGSKIDKNSGKREDYHKVKQILSAENLILDNNLKIRLIGIKEDKSLSKEAIEFLTEKIKGKKVYLKYDTIKHDDNNNLLCYLYLENKTFINAHLLKKGLAKADISFDYTNKTKFINYYRQGVDEQKERN
jgi:modification methylase